MASFKDLVRAQRQSGKSAITSLSGAYNQLNMQRLDPRNALFSQTGLMTALFPSLKGYQASPVSKKSPTSMLSPELSGSPTALSSIARDARISARNSMALPSIARNMAQLVRIWGGTPSKYFEGARQREEKYESKFGTGKKGLPGLGKTAGGGGFNILGMLGGIGSAAGSLLGGVGSVVGSILGGIGSLLGGAVSGIFGILKGALGGMGLLGVVLAAASGFVLYQIFKNVDFSALGKGIGGTLSSIQESLSGLFKDVDNMSDGKLSKFINDVKDTFSSVAMKTAAAVQTAIKLMTDLGLAATKDFVGYLQNFYEVNKGEILAAMTIAAMGPGALSSLKGAALTTAITGLAYSYGKLSADSPDRLNEKINAEESMIKQAEERKSKTASSTEKKNIQDEIDTRRKRIEEYQNKIKAFSERTSNLQKAVDQVSSAGSIYEENLNQRKAEAGSPTPAKAESGKVTFNSLTTEQQNAILNTQFKQEGNRKGDLAYDLNNPGAMIYGPFAAKYGAIPNTTRGTLKDSKGNLVPFAQFPTFEAGRNAQRDLWKAKYGNMPLDDALRKWVAPRNAAEEAQLSKYTAGIYGTLGMPTGESRTAQAEKPKPESKQLAVTEPSMSDSVSSLVYNQIAALDNLMGGKLSEGSIKYSDMLRDITKEFMNNPTFVDSSQTVNNTMPPGLASAVGSAYNADSLRDLLDRQT